MEASIATQDRAEAGRRVESTVLEIRWHGRGGQGVVTAAKLLAAAALSAEMYFQAFPDYGPERMGAPIRAFTRLSKNPIHDHSQITTPDVVVVLDPTVLKAVDVVEGLAADGNLIVNTVAAPQALRQQLGWHAGRVFTVDASAIAMKHLGREITNTPMLGALASATGLFEVGQLAEQIRREFGEKFGERTVQANIAAMNEAAEKLEEG